MKQKIVIKLDLHCDKCRTKALRKAAAVEGVHSVALEGNEKDKVVVVGEGVDAACLTNCLRKKFKYARLESVEEVKPKKEEPEKDKEEQKNKPCSPCCEPRPPCQFYTVVCEPDPPPTCSIM